MLVMELKLVLTYLQVRGTCSPFFLSFAKRITRQILIFAKLNGR